MIIRHAAGGKVARLLRTGLLPSAAHGARVSGMSDTGLRTLRATAGALVGAKPACSLTAYLFLQYDTKYDPIVDCTVSIVHEYATWIWEGRGSLSQLAPSAEKRVSSSCAPTTPCTCPQGVNRSA